MLRINVTLRCNVTPLRYAVKMGRPAQHDEQTRATLLAVAEQLLTDHGPDAVSVRAVANGAETSTRAVYSLFGAKEGLLAALAERGFETLGQLVQALPVTADPIADLVAAGMDGFRTWALAHPALYRLTFDCLAGASDDQRVVDAGRAALEHLRSRVARAAHAGLLGDRDIDDAIHQFHALCEGIATVELRGMVPTEHAERLAHDALEALLNGMSTTTAPARRRATRRVSPPERG